MEAGQVNSCSCHAFQLPEQVYFVDVPRLTVVITCILLISICINNDTVRLLAVGSDEEAPGLTSAGAPGAHLLLRALVLRRQLREGRLRASLCGGPLQRLSLLPGARFAQVVICRRSRRAASSGTGACKGLRRLGVMEALAMQQDGAISATYQRE